MPSTSIDSQIHGCLFSTDEMREIFSDQSLAQAWVDTEAALAQAQGELGIIPKEKADYIVSHTDVSKLDIPAIGEAYKSSITIVPLVKAYQKYLLPSDAGEYLHWGATSQDIVDTGLILLQKKAYAVILRDMKICQQHCLDLAKKWRNQGMCGRTHVIHAVPITLGYKIAVWADELGRDIERLEEIAGRVFVGQLSGAVGTLASLKDTGKALEMQKRMMEILHLGVPTISWHVARDSQAVFSSTLAICAGTLARIAHEVLTLQRSETMEIEEPFFMGKIGSSTMPHKRNPQVVEGIIAVCRNVRSIAPSIVEAMFCENERDWGCLLSEWEGIPRQCHLLGQALEKTKYVLKDLIVYPKHMEQNLKKLHGLIMSECVMMHLAPCMGRLTAHEVVYEDSMKAYEEETYLGAVLKSDPRVTEVFSEAEIDHMMDPHTYIGYAPEFVDRVLAKYGA